MDGPPLTEAAPVVDHLGRFIQKPNADPGMQGATAHVVVVTDNNYLFCNLGDSRGYLCRRRVQRDLSPEGFARSWSVAQQQRHHSPRSSPGHTRGRLSSAVMPDEAPILLTGGLEIPTDVDSDGGVDTPPIATSSPRTTGGGGQFTLRKTTDAPGGLAIPHVQSYQGSPNLDRSRVSNSPRYGFGAEEGGGDTSDGSPRTTLSEEPPRPTLFTSAGTAVFRAPSSNAASPNHHQGGGVSGDYSTSVVGSAFDDDRHEESRGDDEIDASGDLEESTADIYGGYTIEAIPMSTDHRTLQNEAEKQRVLDAGGFVINNRVNGKLSVTRAFGDFDLKPNMSPSHASRISKVESTVSAVAAVTSNSTSMSSPLAIPSPESADTSTSAPLTPPQAMPPLAPRPVATSTTSKNTTSPAPPANPVSNTPDIAIVDRLGNTLSSIGGVGSPMRTADGSLTSSAAAATPDPNSNNNSPTPTVLDIHSPYPFAAYDILLVGCDGVWELQTAEVIGKRAVDAVEAVLQPVRNAILQGRNFPVTSGNDSTGEYPTTTIPSLPPMYPPPNQHRGSTSTSGVVSPRKGSAHHTLSSCDARRFHTPLSVGGLTADGKFIRTHSSHTNEEGPRRLSSHVAVQQRQCSPSHSITHNDDPAAFSNEAMSVSLSPRSPRTFPVGETGGDVSSMQLLTEKLESTLRDVVVTSLNAACSVHCDPKGTTPGCDNLSLGIMLVAA